VYFGGMMNVTAATAANTTTNEMIADARCLRTICSKSAMVNVLPYLFGKFSQMVYNLASTGELLELLYPCEQ